jgi:uncharacterized protein (DUF1778 family)
MSVTSPRDRVITFRLSGIEYDNVSTAAEREGSRSISEFARTAALARAIEIEGKSDWQQLRALQETLEQMVSRLGWLGAKLRMKSRPSESAEGSEEQSSM